MESDNKVVDTIVRNYMDKVKKVMVYCKEHELCKDCIFEESAICPEQKLHRCTQPPINSQLDKWSAEIDKDLRRGCNKNVKKLIKFEMKAYDYSIGVKEKQND